MFVYRINENNKPLFPVNPAFARKLLGNNEAFVFNESPFIIKMNVFIQPKVYKLFLYVNVTFSGIEFIVISERGEIFLSKTLYSETFISNLEGLFLYIHEILPITHCYFTINENAINQIDLLHNKIFTFTDFKTNFSYLLKRDECVYCRRNFDFENYSIIKIKKDHSFYGNNVLVCKDCINRYKNNEENDYIKLINYLYDIEEYIFNYYKENFMSLEKENKEN